MPSVGDVVELFDGSVGVISEDLPSARFVQLWRVAFPESHLDVLAVDISQTLATPAYEVGQEVTVWPHLGTIQAIDGQQITVRLDRAERIEGVGHIQWEPDVIVPLWRVIQDNDGRLQRIW